MLKLNFGDHVWVWKKPRKIYKCLTCGGVTTTRPIAPTPMNWMPDKYEPLDTEDRTDLKDLEKMR